jgi:glyoxylase I family protein
MTGIGRVWPAAQTLTRETALAEPSVGPAVTGAGWLDSLGIENSGVVDTADPVPYSVVVFRDPDNIQLELIYMAG